MIGEECKFLHPAPCRKYMKNPERCCRAECRATIPNSASIQGPQGNVTTIDASEYISRAQGASKQHLRSRNQVQLHEIQFNNKLRSKNKTWLTTAPTLVNTPHPAYHRHSLCPPTNSLPHPTRYTISHHPSEYRSTVP